MAQKIKVIIKRPDEEYGHVTNISDTTLKMLDEDSKAKKGDGDGAQVCCFIRRG